MMPGMTAVALRPYQGLPARIKNRLVEQPGPLPTPCLVWTGPTVDGYASASWGGRERKLHRVIYELLMGSVAQGLVLDHLCRERACVKVDHLEQVTQRVNILRGEGLAAQQIARTHCPSGHPYDDENTYILPSRPTARYCKECNRLNKRERRARARVAQ